MSDKSLTYPMEFYPIHPMVNFPVNWNIPNVDGTPSRYYVDDGCHVFSDRRLDGNLRPLYQYYNKFNRQVVTVNLGTGFSPKLTYRLYMRAMNPTMPIEEFNKLVVDHIDANTRHNYKENLELVTPAENSRRAAAMGLMPSGEDHYRSKYKDSLVHKICKDLAAGKLGNAKIAQKHGIDRSLVDDIKCGISHVAISSQYTDKGFMYTYEETVIKKEKAHMVCRLLERGLSVLDIVRRTGFDYNFVRHIAKKNAHRDVSAQYNI